MLINCIFDISRRDQNAPSDLLAFKYYPSLWTSILVVIVKTRASSVK